MSGSGEVICEGWLRKSPPEKKLRRYAWKRRWFVLRSGRLSGEPDVLQYYKNQQSRRPIRTINLHLCEQVDAGLTFTKKELQSSFVFDLRTEERVWYLVSESEEDMNRWVSCICLLCGFNPTQEDLISGSLSDRASVFEFSESFNSYFMNKGLVPLGSEDEDVDENYVPMSAAPTEPPVAPRAPPPPRSDSPPLQDTNYVPMTPLPPSLPLSPPPASGELAFLGRQVPPPAHLGFRNSPLSPLTPPLRRNTTAGGEAAPPPIHRNLKPQRRGVSQSAERTASQSAAEPRHRTRVKPAPLDLPLQQDWQEVPPPCPLTCHSNLHTRSLHSPSTQTPLGSQLLPPLLRL
ncbi:hypothetical protein CesoFtcFv8_026605 [Champsocephalus esox]|uniref:PH domain-containing protein n=1 Tax=Champsocephalus esox TaxID=159716 RepID=A0AAN8AZG0_9TELE|nr:hypothetical protein CesoFtcFv8_026605 [Champsocephalus esox]